MSKVRIHAHDKLEWNTLSSMYPPQMAAEMTDAELDSVLAYHEPGLDGSLHLTEQKYLPHAHFELHAHDQAEIIYVLDGTIRLGNRELAPGSSIFIDRDTLYAFAAGDWGSRMAVGNAQYFSKDT